MTPFYHYRKKVVGRTNRLIVILLPLILVLTGCTFTREASVVVNDEQIRITGIIYREKIPIEQLNQVFLANTLPDITLRTNGLAIGATREGYFRSGSLGRIKLFLYSQSAPFLYIIYGDNDKHVILNFRDKERTLEVYEQLRVLVEK